MWVRKGKTGDDFWGARKMSSFIRYQGENYSSKWGITCEKAVLGGQAATESRCGRENGEKDDKSRIMKEL